MKRSFVFAIVAVVAGCASITGSRNQPVSVVATHNGKPIEADCVVNNDKGTWYLKTPGSVVVQKSGQNLAVSCNKDGVPSGTVSVPSSHNGSVFGNILFGGFIGYAVDASTGAAFDYPNSLGVQMGQVVTLDKPTPTVSQSDQAQQLSPQQTTGGGLTFVPAGNSESALPKKTLSSAETAKKLRELKRLQQEGVLTKEEYESKKTEILKGM